MTIARRTAEAAADPTPLETLESSQGYYGPGQPAYSIGPSAVQLLIGQVRPESLLRYYSLIGQGLE